MTPTVTTVPVNVVTDDAHRAAANQILTEAARLEKAFSFAAEDAPIRHTITAMRSVARQLLAALDQHAAASVTTFEQRLAAENPDIPADEIAAHVEDIYDENPDLAF